LLCATVALAAVPLLMGVGSAASAATAPPHPAALHVTTLQPGVAPGLLITNPIKIYNKKPVSWTGGPTIYDNAGHVVWYKPSTSIHTTEPVTYQGKPALAYYQITTVEGGFNAGYWVILDQSYRKVAEIHAGNGLMADHHELVLTDHDTALIDCYHPVTMDLSQYGGSKTATVWEGVVQEVSLTTGKVLFEWHSLKYVPVSDTYNKLTTDSVDYFHMNAIAEDTDGNLIVSGRFVSTIFKIDRSTGAVMWRLGGKHSDFQFAGGDSGPSMQHDVRVVTADTYSAFDNGDLRNPPYSRGVTWHVDLATHTATVIGEWRHNPDLYSSIMGSNRILVNGDRLIDWALGGNGTTTEYAGADHTVVFESTFGNYASSYRVYRTEWHATPTSAPTIGLTRSGGTVRANVNWNGATDIVQWQLLSGPDANHLTVVQTAPYRGYQAALTTPTASSKRVFEVRAVRVTGMTTGISRVAPLK
jgi:hypothetical protein